MILSHEVRRSFLAFFEQNGHRIVPSSSLVPGDDPTLLFTNAGMNQFKDVFLGKERREYTRAATVQKCMRVSGKHNDLDNVGPSIRHHTFFEMLGNFSFGDYFKKDAIELAWTLLTEVWKLPPDRLYATIFKGEAGIPRDEEAYGHWRRFVPAERIAELGLTDNFWAMGDTGPCGRCSEIHYFRGSALLCPEPTCRGIECSCDRFVEIWNNVFMEFDRQPDGVLRPLPAPSIDTGMGLERITAVLQNKLSNYDTDLFTPIIRVVEQLSGTSYAADAETAVSMRVIADHVRAATFLAADGVMPSNEWRGYVLRKILRRAMRHGNRLGLAEPSLYQLVDVLVPQMGDTYPEVRTGRDAIVKIIRNEEERFEAVLNAGLRRLEETLDRAASATRVVSGEEAFRLYDSLGLPLEFIEDMADERKLVVDRAGFERAMEEQRQKGRAASAFEARRDREFHARSDEAREILQTMPDIFEGYATTRVPGVAIRALFDGERRQVAALRAGEPGFVVLERTPFYIEAGGQVSDGGRIFSEAGGSDAIVEGLTRLSPGGPRAHRVRMSAGELREREIVTAEVDAELRDATRRNHTATHLLHAALRQVLGSHVKQAGSLVAPDRLRFDFIHFAALTQPEIDQIERLVNEQVYRNTTVMTEVRSTQEAIAAGAMALFGEKYGDRVRVVSIPGFSTELCGGTHCKATGDIGFFMITQETGVAAGVRRIEALTGADAVLRHQERRSTLRKVLDALKTVDDRAADAAIDLQAEVKRLTKQNKELRSQAAIEGLRHAGSMEPRAQAAIDGPRQALPDVKEFGGIRMLAHEIHDIDGAGLRELAERLRDELDCGVVVLASAADGKVSVVVSVKKTLTHRLDASRLVKEIAPIVGGGGGGRPDFAEAGGRDASKISELLARSLDVVERMVRSPHPNPLPRGERER